MDKNEIVNRTPTDNVFLTPTEKINVAKSPYAAYENEKLVSKSSLLRLDREKITMHIQSGILKIKDEDCIDLDIIKSLNELQLASSRMISHYLHILGIDIRQDKIQKRLIYLLKLKIVSSYEFKSIDEDGVERKLKTSIYYLDEGAKHILKNYDIRISDNSFSGAMKSKTQAKEILSRNQTMLNYISSIQSVEFTKIEPTFRINNDLIYRPALLIAFNNKKANEYYLFEFIRTYDNWEIRTKEKLIKYREFANNFNPSKTIQTLPQLILVAEDDIHAFAIFKLVLSSKLEPSDQRYLYSTDTRIISDNIVENSLFIFDITGESEVRLKFIKLSFWNDIYQMDMYIITTYPFGKICKE